MLKPVRPVLLIPVLGLIALIGIFRTDKSLFDYIITYICVGFVILLILFIVAANVGRLLKLNEQDEFFIEPIPNIETTPSQYGLFMKNTVTGKEILLSECGNKDYLTIRDVVNYSLSNRPLIISRKKAAEAIKRHLE